MTKKKVENLRQSRGRLVRNQGVFKPCYVFVPNFTILFPKRVLKII